MNDIEAVCVRIYTSSGCIYLYCLYIQPTATMETYRHHIEAIELLMKQINNNDTIHIFGDFNFSNIVKWIENDSGYDYIPVVGESQSAKALIVRESTSRLLDVSLFQISNFANKNGSVLETVFTNSPETSLASLADFRLIPPSKSDECHFPYYETDQTPIASTCTFQLKRFIQHYARWT